MELIKLAPRDSLGVVVLVEDVRMVPVGGSVVVTLSSVNLLSSSVTVVGVEACSIGLTESVHMSMPV